MKVFSSLSAVILLTTSAAAENPVAVMKTSMGEITIELDRENAPITVANFLTYVEKKHFDGTIFHRVIGNFMIQGGGFAKGNPPTEKRGLKPIKNEAKTSGLSNVRGTIAMARTMDPDSATAQFFINVVDNGKGKLDPGGFSPDGYAVFGEVTDGMATVDKIRKVRTRVSVLKLRTPGGQVIERPMQDVPVEQVTIESVSLKKTNR